jgi:flagellar protein FlbD
VNSVIRLTRLNGQTLYVNAELIQQIEPIPDTLITLTSGAKLIVREAAEVIVKQMIHYQQIVRNPDSVTEGTLPWT